MSLSEKIDKSTYKIIRTADDFEAEATYWLDKTPQERLEAVEYLRQQFIRLHNLPTRLDKSVFGISYGK